jgi:predicted Zn-dependent peptidase
MAEYEKSILPNGLRVIKVPMPQLRSAVAAIYIKAGPRYEPRSHNGISHFVEHMLFKGTPTYPEAIHLSEALARIGADMNGGTTSEYTEIFLTAHHRHFLDALAIFAEMLTQPLFRPEEVERERPVIANEIARDCDDAGEITDIDELSCNLMWPDASYSFSCLGRPEHIAQLTRDDLWQHYCRFYTPSNMVLCITGNYAANGIDARLTELFGGVNRPAFRPTAEPPEPQQEPRSLFRSAHTQTVYLKLCHKSCSYRDPQLVPTLVINDILGGGVSSRLFAALREKHSLVYDVSSLPTLFSDAGSIDIFTSTTGKSVAPTVDAALDVIEDLAAHGANGKELETYKQRVACHMDLLLDSPMEMAEWYGIRELLMEPTRLDTPEDEAAKLLAVTRDDIVGVARRIFTAQRRSIVVLGPCGWTQRRRIRKRLQR